MNKKYKIIKNGSSYELFDKDSKSLGIFYYTSFSFSYLGRDAKIILKNSSYTIKSKDCLTNKDKAILPRISRRIFTVLLNDKSNVEQGTFIWTSFNNQIKTCEFKKSDNTTYKTSELSTTEWSDQKGENVVNLKTSKGFLKTKEIEVETRLDLSDEENIAFLFWAFYRVVKIEYIAWPALILLTLFFIPVILQLLFNIP